jgi:hypothetical protein
MVGHGRGIQLDAGGFGRHATGGRAFIFVHAATEGGPGFINSIGNRVS